MLTDGDVLGGDSVELTEEVLVRVEVGVVVVGVVVDVGGVLADVESAIAAAPPNDTVSIATVIVDVTTAMDRPVRCRDSRGLRFTVPLPSLRVEAMYRSVAPGGATVMSSRLLNCDVGG